MFQVILDTILPEALMMGVDYGLFWTLNPKSLDPFTKAFSLRKKQEDMNAWNIGNYVRMAIASSFSNSVKYPDKPYTMTKAPREKTPEDIKEYVKQRAMAINSRFGKEE